MDNAVASSDVGFAQSLRAAAQCAAAGTGTGR
jgi:hypothetical protein